MINHEDQELKLSDDAGNDLDDYMTAVEEASDIVKACLEDKELTQTDMNMKSQELYELWDEALNHLWG